jgi:twitching motility protein PilT
METFHRILAAAVEGGASDIHIKVGTPVAFRINRQLIDIEGPIPTVEWIGSVLEKVIPKHVHARFETNRETDFSYFLPGVGRFRTNVFQQRGSMAMAMRYVRSQVPDAIQLGLMPITNNLADAPRGIVLVAGTTGSGKSTTLASMIEHINGNSRRHIVTLEDPIEYVFEDNQSIIEQREVGLDTPSFASALKNALRQDPDVIMIGEMRDSISFAAAMNAADTGHLVLSTVHTTNASQSVTRVLDYFKAEERDQVRRQLAGTLKAVICQRMVPKISGGVVPAQEIMINTGTVRKLIEDNRLEKLAAAIETGGEDGMQDFNQALFKLVQDGVVSKEEALERATNPAALEMNFQGIFLSQGKRILG